MAIKRLTEAELFRADAIEVARTAINLKHRIAARRERNDVLPDLEETINGAITGGKPLELSAADLFNAAFEGDTDAATSE